MDTSVAVLDLIVQVKKAELAYWSSIERIVGFDWGVNTLITAVVLQANPTDPERPLRFRVRSLSTLGGLDGHQARTRRQIDELKAAGDSLP